MYTCNVFDTITCLEALIYKSGMNHLDSGSVCTRSFLKKLYSLYRGIFGKSFLKKLVLMYMGPLSDNHTQSFAKLFKLVVNPITVLVSWVRCGT